LPLWSLRSLLWYCNGRNLRLWARALRSTRPSVPMKRLPRYLSRHTHGRRRPTRLKTAPAPSMLCRAAAPSTANLQLVGTTTEQSRLRRMPTNLMSILIRSGPCRFGVKTLRLLRRDQFLRFRPPKTRKDPALRLRKIVHTHSFCFRYAFRI